MEDYDLKSRCIFPLSPPKGVAHWSIGVTAANAASRATLGLGALYVAVDAGRKRVAGRPLEGAVPPFRCSRGDSIPIEDAGNGSAHELGNKQGGEVGGRDSSASRISAVSLAAMPLFGHRYRCGATIGTGTFAVVIRADDTFRRHRSVAIKVMDLGCEAIGIREMRCVRFLNSVPRSEFHPVVKLLDVLTFRGHLCLVMELMKGTLLPYMLRAAAAGRREEIAPPMCDEGRDEYRGLSYSGLSAHEAEPASTRQRLLREPLRGVGSVGGIERSDDSGMRSSGGLPTCVLRHVALQLVSALLLLHNHGIIHADIKPQNVLLRIDGNRETAAINDALPSCSLEDFMNGRASTGVQWGVFSSARLTVKLCDFGNAIHRSETCLYYDDFDIQSLAYRAPEVLMGCPFGPAIDTWGVGVMLLELVLGRPLFHTASSRAALLRQTVCAFGPLPLRRFRVGRYYSEYFAQNQSLKASMPDTEGSTRLGCCPCCWMGNRLRLDRDGQAHVASTSCEGACAERCRLLDTHKGSCRGNQGTGISTTAFTLPARRGSSFPGSTRRTEAPVTPESGGWMAARAHLCRLVSAADAAAAKRATSSAGGYDSSTSSTVRHNPRLLSLLAGLLCLNPDERLTPVQALAHPFFGEVLPFAIPLAAGAGTPKAELAPKPPNLGNRLDSMVATTRTSETPAYAGEGGRREQGSKWGSVVMPGSRSTNPQGSSRIRGSTGANADVEAQGSHPRSNGCSTVNPPAAGRSWVPFCPDNVSATGTSSSLTSAGGPDSTGVVNTRSQLLRLTDMATGMYIKHQPHTSGGRDGGRNGTSGVALASRRNRLLGGSLPTTTTPREGLPRVQSRCEPAASAESGALAEERGVNEPETTPAAASARAQDGFMVPGQGRPNRFLSPSTMAMLNPDLREKGKDTATVTRGRHAADKVLAVGAGETTPRKQTPPNCALSATSIEDQTCSSPKTSTGATQQESREVLQLRGSFHVQEPAARTRPKRRVSSAFEQAGNGKIDRAVVARRTTTPRRRAAVAAGRALSRAREEDTDSEQES